MIKSAMNLTKFNLLLSGIGVALIVSLATIIIGINHLLNL